LFGDYDEEGKVEEFMGPLDLNSRSRMNVDWMATRMWPHVKVYNFADNLKDIAMSLYGLTYKQCYGTDSDKDTPTKIKWSDISFVLAPRTVGLIKSGGKFNEFVTAREFMQTFGSDMCRRINPDVWAESCYQQVIDEGVPLAIIGDGRFENELMLGKEVGAKIVGYTKNQDSEDGHKSENSLKDWDDYDLLLDNANMEMAVKHGMLEDFLLELGWILSGETEKSEDKENE
jgi:hypothetical protein